MMGDAQGHHGEEYERLLCQERLILDVTELLAGALEDGGVTRAELARRLGRTPGFVSQLLGGRRKPDPPDHCGHRRSVVFATVVQVVQ